MFTKFRNKLKTFDYDLKDFLFCFYRQFLLKNKSTFKKKFNISLDNAFHKVFKLTS